MADIIETGHRIGPTLVEELIAADLGAVEVGWTAEGVFTFDDSVSDVDKAAVLAVVAAHDPVPNAFAIASIEAVGGDASAVSQSFIPGAVGATAPAFGTRYLGAAVVIPSQDPIVLTVAAILNKPTLPFQLLSFLLDETTLSATRVAMASSVSWSCRQDPIWGENGTNPAHFTAADFDVLDALAQEAEYNLAGLFQEPGALAHIFVPPLSIMAGFRDPDSLAGVPASTTRYFQPNGSALTFNVTESDSQVPAMYGMGALGLRIVTATTQPASGDLTVKLRINGADSGLSVVIAANSPAGAYPPTALIVGGPYSRVGIEADDLLSLSCANAASSESAHIRGAGFLYVMTEPLL